MRREARVLLWDAREAAEDIAKFLADCDRSAYLSDKMLRSAVERQLIIIGEALNRLSQDFPVIAEKIPQLREVVGFRHVVVHGYAMIDHARVWRIATERVPELVDLLDDLLGEVHE